MLTSIIAVNHFMVHMTLMQSYKRKVESMQKYKSVLTHCKQLCEVMCEKLSVPPYSFEMYLLFMWEERDQHEGFAGLVAFHR